MNARQKMLVERYSNGKPDWCPAATCDSRPQYRGILEHCLGIVKEVRQPCEHLGSSLDIDLRFILLKPSRHIRTQRRPDKFLRVIPSRCHQRNSASERRSDYSARGGASHSVKWCERNPTRIDGKCGDHFLQADLNEAALRRTHSPVTEPTAEVI